MTTIDIYFFPTQPFVQRTNLEEEDKQRNPEFACLQTIKTKIS
jgi:hypothetical protein